MNLHPICGRLTAIVLLTLVSASCGDGDALLFPVASELQVEWSEPGAPVVGNLIGDPIQVRIVDHRGNPVPAVPVTIEVVEGAGAIGSPTKQSGDDGAVVIRSWRMGETVGTNRLRLSAPGIEPLDLQVVATPGSPRALEPAGALPEAPQVATTLTDVTPLRVLDRFGNPVPGATVRFTASGDGSVATSEVTSDAEGLAHQPGWTLGTTAGPQVLRATIPNVTAIQLEVEAAAGPPVTIERIAADGQRVEAGLIPIDPPGMFIMDAYGNGVPGVPVEFQILAGGGTLQAADAVSDAEGRARAMRWITGSVPGVNRISVEVAGFAPEAFEVETVPVGSEPEGRYYRVRSVHVNQSTQDLEGTVPLVGSRPGLLRVFVEGSEEGSPPPVVEVVLTLQGSEVLREQLEIQRASSPPLGIPTSAGGPSWDLPLTADVLVDGLEVEVLVDPDQEIGVFTRRWARFPEAGGSQPLHFTTPQAFRVRFVPLRDSGSGAQGNITFGNLDQFMASTRRMLPIGVDSVHLGAPFTTDLVGEDGRVRSRLAQMRQWWLSSDFRDHYFHGIYPASLPRSFSGIAYRPSNPASPAPIAMTVDALPGASNTVAHEFGHNLGIRHAPCGNPAGVDTLYPYDNASLGRVGWDRNTGNFLDPSTNRDLMSYCGPRWISDYNYRMMLAWRVASPLGVPAGAPVAQLSAVDAPPQPGLLVVGTITSAGASLLPAYGVTARPHLPPDGGSHTLRGLDATGTTVFSIAFEPDEVPHAEDPTERHFGFVIPLSPAERARIARLELEAPQAPAAAQWSRVFAGPAGVAGALDAFRLPEPGDHRQRLTFDRTLFPQALVRDAATGELLGILEEGEVPLALWDREVEVLLADGLELWEVTPAGALERR
jgi:hypothetical protein